MPTDAVVHRCIQSTHRVDAEFTDPRPRGIDAGSDVGPGIPKSQQDETARALEYAIQYTKHLQKSLDAIVPLDRDAS